MIVDRIQCVKAINGTLQVVIDWKHLPPSDPDKAKNWFPITEVAQSLVTEFLENPDNKQQFLDQLNELPAKTQQKLNIQFNLIPQQEVRKRGRPRKVPDEFDIAESRV